MEKNTFGELLRKKRQECRMSQYQLGRLLKVSDKAVSKWENGLAKPKSQLLYQLSNILGITVDELLAGEEQSSDKKKRCCSEVQYKNLWNKAYDILMNRYHDMPSIEIINRFENERLALMNTDMILFFDLISQISKRALEKKCPIVLEGGTGASFVAFLLGASDINPLPAHYYCPVCKKTEFVQKLSDGWGLTKKYCDNCHSLLVRDGHNIPFEVYRHIINRNAGFDLVISKFFYEEAKEIILQYFGNYSVVILNPPSDVMLGRHVSKMVTFVIRLEHEPTIGKLDIGTYEDYYTTISDKPYINLIFDDMYEKCIALEKQVNISGTEIDFLDDEVQKRIFETNMDGMPDFGLRGLWQLFRKFEVKSIDDVIRVYGIALCASVLSENESATYIERQVKLEDTITYRDDLFLYLCTKMKNYGWDEFGFAFMVMDKTRKGIYHGCGVNQYTHKLLLNIGVSEQYIAHLEEIPYLFPKAQGIMMLKRSLILLWYKIHYPVEFQHAFVGNNNEY